MRRGGPGANAKAHLLARRLRVPAVSRTPGRLRDPPLGHYDPCARSSLTAPVHRGDKRGPELSHLRKRVARAAAERREARPARVMGRVISGAPEMGPTARRATGAAFRTSACRRSAPLIFRRGAPNWEWSARGNAAEKENACANANPRSRRP